ncbi:MAG: RNA-binding protein Jag [Myxococcaceae bacterium]|nr:RNA-binding protein Jag [Myxococcaceae bacterium]
MDERRHNMDGALFVDEERTTDSRDTRARTDERAPRPRSSYDDDGKAEAARRVTQGILDRMDLEASVHVRENDEAVVLDIDGPDAGRAIGKKGMTLEALQFLVNKIVNRDPDERRHIVLDSGDYRERHDNGLISMAKREAKRAVTAGRPVTLEPMSARDRRVIHVSLSNFPGITTRSEGEGLERRLQIIPARGGRGGERQRDDRRDERPRERPERTSERVGDRTVRDDRPRPAAARDDRPRPAARSDRPVASERERSSDRERPVASERERSSDRDRPVSSERGRPVERERERPVSNERDRPIDRDRPAPREPQSERERLTERDRPVERSRVAEPRRERDGSRGYGDAPAPAPARDTRDTRDAAPAPSRDYDDRRGR